MQLLDYTLGEILEKWAFETPDKEFMVYPDRDLRFTYSQFNQRDDIWCERVFAPWLDFEEVMRQNNIPLYL